ncbi:hypothetical protein LCGC14_1422620 [marine sediment metagenome]|uniref:Uncharacterized protein n=1 Tax=marine sediment metagenome TaxID=412755 RepID=A0A0F9JQQ0_9ZZZZ
MSRLIDLTGQKFERLLVVKYAGKKKSGATLWLCVCDCSKEKIIIGSHLKNGNTKSCGCLQKEIASISHAKHGHKTRAKTSKTYQSWQSMIKRCVNPKNKDYLHYGGRGIKVCQRWRNSFENFLKDMHEAPEGYQIDRIDNDGNYCKSNCRWVTSRINNRNKRNNHLITYNNKTQCLIEWAEDYDIPYKTLFARINILGWPMGKALTTPVGKQNKKKVL